MLQLTTAAMYHLRSPSVRRCPYQANVMKTLETVSMRAVWTRTGTETPLLRQQVLVVERSDALFKLLRMLRQELDVADRRVEPQFLRLARGGEEPLAAIG